MKMGKSTISTGPFSIAMFVYYWYGIYLDFLGMKGPKIHKCVANYALSPWNHVVSWWLVFRIITMTAMTGWWFQISKYMAEKNG